MRKGAYETKYMQFKSCRPEKEKLTTAHKKETSLEKQAREEVTSIFVFSLDLLLLHFKDTFTYIYIYIYLGFPIINSTMLCC